MSTGQTSSAGLTHSLSEQCVWEVEYASVLHVEDPSLSKLGDTVRRRSLQTLQRVPAKESMS